jgi:hypothetical protein
MHLDFHEMDSEDIANYLCGSIDAIADMASGQAMGNSIDPNNLACLMRLIGAVAHQMLDPKEGPTRPPAGSRPRVVDD